MFDRAIRSWLFAELIGRVTVAMGAIFTTSASQSSSLGTVRFDMNSADAALAFIEAGGVSVQVVSLIWDLVALNSTPSLALHKEPEVAVGTMGIGLDYGGFGLEATPGRRCRPHPQLRSPACG